MGRHGDVPNTGLPNDGDTGRHQDPSDRSQTKEMNYAKDPSKPPLRRRTRLNGPEAPRYHSGHASHHPKSKLSPQRRNVIPLFRDRQTGVTAQPKSAHPDSEDRPTGAEPEQSEPAPTAPRSSPDPAPGSWQDHPITKALESFYDPSKGLTPVQIIADSVARPSKARAPVPEPQTPPHEQLAKEQSKSDEAPTDQAQAAEITEVSDESEFWDVWLGHQDYLRNQCIRLMAGNMADAEDALSNAMVRASQKFLYYSGRIVNEKAWLSKLVYNVCIDHYRREKRTECRAFDQEGSGMDSDAMFTEPQQSPEDIALCQEQIRELEKLVSELSNNLRVPLFLRCVEGWSYPDIAKQLDIRTDTVRKRIQLARDHLRRSNIR